jgi:hypothetical protein
MKLYIYTLLIIPCLLFSQDIEKIKVTDTLYIYFKNDNVNQIKNLANSKHPSFNYIFVYDLKGIKPRQSFNLFEDYRTEIPETKLVRKSFLKKNKNIIVDYDFFCKIGFREAEQLLFNKKKLYLIDNDNIYCFKIKILEVKIFDNKLLVPDE